MLLGTMPAASNRATWIEQIEFRDIDDDQLVDFSGMDEISLKIRDAQSFTELITITKTGGGITTPSTGIIELRVEKSVMSGLVPKTYEVAIEMTEGTEVVSLLLGHLPVYGW